MSFDPRERARAKEIAKRTETQMSFRKQRGLVWSKTGKIWHRGGRFNLRYTLFVKRLKSTLQQRSAAKYNPCEGETYYFVGLHQLYRRINVFQERPPAYIDSKKWVGSEIDKFRLYFENCFISWGEAAKNKRTMAQRLYKLTILGK